MESNLALLENNARVSSIARWIADDEVLVLCAKSWFFRPEGKQALTADEVGACSLVCSQQVNPYWSVPHHGSLRGAEKNLDLNWVIQTTTCWSDGISNR